MVFNLLTLYYMATQFNEAFQLKGWRVTEIKADLNFNYIVNTLAVLKQWRSTGYIPKFSHVLESKKEGTLANQDLHYNHLFTECRDVKSECDSSTCTVDYRNR